MLVSFVQIMSCNHSRTLRFHLAAAKPTPAGGSGLSTHSSAAAPPPVASSGKRKAREISASRRRRPTLSLSSVCLSAVHSRNGQIFCSMGKGEPGTTGIDEGPAKNCNKDQLVFLHLGFTNHRWGLQSG